MARPRQPRGMQVTSGGLFITVPKAVDERVYNWKLQFTQLCKDFCIDADSISRIVSNVESKANACDSQEILYARAWRQFKAII